MRFNKNIIQIHKYFQGVSTVKVRLKRGAFRIEMQKVNYLWKRR